MTHEVTEDSGDISPETRWLLVLERFRSLPLDLLSREKWDLEKKDEQLRSRRFRNRLKYWCIGLSFLFAYILFGFTAVEVLLSRIFPRLIAYLGGLAWFVFLITTSDGYPKRLLGPIQEEEEVISTAIRSNGERINLAKKVFTEKTRKPNEPA